MLFANAMSPFFKKVYDAFRWAVNREIAQIYLDDFALNRPTECVVQLFQTWRHGICRKHAAVMEGRLSIKCIFAQRVDRQRAYSLCSQLPVCKYVRDQKRNQSPSSLPVVLPFWQTACMLSSAPTAVIPQESACGVHRTLTQSKDRKPRVSAWTVQPQTLGTDPQGRTDAVYVTVPEDSVAELILHCSRTSALNFRKPKVWGWTVQPQALSIASEATQMERWSWSCSVLVKKRYRAPRLPVRSHPSDAAEAGGRSRARQGRLNTKEVCGCCKKKGLHVEWFSMLSVRK